MEMTVTTHAPHASVSQPQPARTRTRTPLFLRASQDTDNDDDRDQQQQEDALITATLAGFLLTAREISDMAAAIYAARVAAGIAAVDAAAATLGATLPDGYDLPDAVLSEMADEANAAAESIAATYAADMQREAEAFMQEWIGNHPGADVQDAAEALRGDLAQHAAERAAWKAEQIAQYESAQGAQAGVQEAIQEMLDGTFVDAEGNPVDTSHAVVTVLPDDSSPDECADYAGEVFTLDDYDSLPQFPMHPFCIHEVVILLDTQGQWLD